ncbi:MAG: hypothetical protein JSS84_10165, partial [Bacteroidetes bacterium]|nr:hypothetical protein [Bacteroidota bacterium]
SQASGAVSNAYQQAGANAAQGITSYGNQQSDLLSSINAPGQQRANNRVNIDSYAQDLGQIARKSKGDDFLAQIRQGGIRRNPYLDLASSLLGGASRAYRGGDDPDYSYLLDANASSGRSTGTWNGYDYLSSLFDPATGSYSNPYAPPETVAI